MLYIVLIGVIAVLLAACVVLVLKYRAVHEDVESVRRKTVNQRKRIGEEHEKRVQRLKEEIEKREQLIRTLKEKLETLKHSSKSEDIKTRILALDTEKNAMQRELEEEKKRGPVEQEVDVEEFVKQKNELSQARIEIKKLKALAIEYQQRYQDILSWGNRLQKEQQRLLERYEELEDRMEESDKTIL